MDPRCVVYDMCRNYVADSSASLGLVLTDKIQGWLRSRSISFLASASSLFDPVLHGRNELACLLQVEAFFKKCDLFSDENASSVAFAAFLESEEICRVTNKRLDLFYSDSPPDGEVVRVVTRVASIIEETLGKHADFLEELPSLVRVTNGATATYPRDISWGALRLKRNMYATARSHAYLEALCTFWGYKYNFRVIHHNRVELVPKNWKTHRTIACEPEGNVALQLAFDSFCKRKLRSRLKVDLSDQSRNQRAALESSVHGKLCTVDLKAASDRLALNVVHLLFPKEWADFFMATRSPYWKFRDMPLKAYQKLSSMGNGYTFTIETLVFAAVCRALGSKEYSVYGDDIIVETELFPKLSALLSYLGFEINEEKSHVSSPLAGIPEDVGAVLDAGRLEVFQRVQKTQTELFRTSGVRALYADSPWGLAGSVAAWLGNVNEASSTRMESNNLLGVYRESCGVHAFGGHLITPFYLRSLRTKRDWALLANNIAGFSKLGGNLWDYVQQKVVEHNIPLGPPVLDTGACVFIDVPTCRRLGLIRTFRDGKGFGPWQPAFKALVPTSNLMTVHDSRGLFLWFIGKNRRKEEPYESSRHSLGTGKYRFKWVRFRTEMSDLMGRSVRLHWWTETLAARKGCQSLS
jgi:hypothetical protein